MKRPFICNGIVIAVLAATAVSLSACAGTHAPAKYANPVFEPVLADPSVVKAEDGYYYAYGTEDQWDDGVVHLVPVVRTNDLVHWTFVRDAFESKPDWKSEGGIWAPDVTLRDDGKYIMYYSLSEWGDSDPGIGVAVSDRPDGPFADKGKLFTSESIGVDNSIDPFFFEDGDGRSYLFWGSFHGIYGIELSPDGLSTVGDKFQIADTQYEAPYIIERDGTYTFFGSVGSCCNGARSTYHVNVGQATSIRGPYADQEGLDLRSYGGTLLLEANDEPDASGRQFVGPGHNAIVTDDQDRDWIVYHAIEASDPLLDNEASKRPLMIDPIRWVDGWPTIKGDEPSRQSITGPYSNKQSTTGVDHE
ncbi:family 43 glycosylhydrolase [Cohnella sp. GCM10027633]|uniref:family 43 glycosylhydrolase n=1 Tax=unclassified Cohnella TaxID=2636738 RepID=UPI0036365DFC